MSAKAKGKVVLLAVKVDPDARAEAIPDGQPICVCRKPNDGVASVVGCSNCGGWFHCDCMSMKERTAQLCQMFLCPSCAVLGEDDQGEPPAEDAEPRVPAVGQVRQMGNLRWFRYNGKRWLNKCQFMSCVRCPTFGTVLNIAIHCKDHKEEDEINVLNKRCAFKGCSTTILSQRSYCSKHQDGVAGGKAARSPRKSSTKKKKKSSSKKAAAKPKSKKAGRKKRTASQRAKAGGEAAATVAKGVATDLADGDTFYTPPRKRKLGVNGRLALLNTAEDNRYDLGEGVSGASPRIVPRGGEPASTGSAIDLVGDSGDRFEEPPSDDTMMQMLMSVISDELQTRTPQVARAHASHG